ncbi:dihydrodipicolinate synthase family protein [Metabacillus sp. RGM 3146]|uniref:dihydrodipicolinate synthase family protein n=1 Tax=Metabacillus sp. RGM 3146 TaxID=3401092 RepID=UPI003B9A98DE
MTMVLKKDLEKLLHEGTVIPAHPLALNEFRELDEKRQRALTRYYMDAGAGGLAVGVHTTQFQIREKGLYEKVLTLAADEAEKRAKGNFLKIAGICGHTKQAINEAETALRLGYHLVLVSLGGLNSFGENELLAHVREIASILPVFGFYLQPAVGGRTLSYSFWREFAEIPNVMAIKTAPFNRYQTLDVVRAVCESFRNERIALYTGNDDNILLDLLTTYEFQVNGRKVVKSFSGGLLGHWAVWTKNAVQLLERVKEIKRLNRGIPEELLTLAMQITDANAAFFDAANGFKGSIPGIHEVLRRQGLLSGVWCLDEGEILSPGQKEEIDRVLRAYPQLNDDAFVKEKIGSWLQKVT